MEPLRYGSRAKRQRPDQVQHLLLKVRSLSKWNGNLTRITEGHMVCIQPAFIGSSTPWVECVQARPCRLSSQKQNKDHVVVVLMSHSGPAIRC